VKFSDYRGLLIVPVFVYVTVLGFSRFDGWDPIVVLVIVGMSLPVVEFFRPESGGRWFGPAGVLAGIAGLGLTFSNGAPTGWLADVGGGVLLGSPITVMLGLLSWRRTRMAFLLGVEAGLAVLLVLLATGEAVVTEAAGQGSSAWLVAFSTVNTLQFNALAQWFQGNIAGPLPPLTSVSDAVFLGLAVLAAFAIVLTLLERPRHAGGGPDPWDPHFSRSSGVVPLVAAAFAGLIFEFTAAVAPGEALLVVAIGVAGTLALLVGLSGYASRVRDRPSAG
jgi:hypothetical protein